MKKKVNIILAFALCLLESSYAQDDWEPQTFITGYVNAIAEYTNLEHLDTTNNNIGIGLSEVGFLVSYKPLANLEIKSTLVYSHLVDDIQTMVVEAYGIYTFNELFKVGAGKFLTPLSPANVYFYAPLNPSGTSPMLISHHFLMPQNLSGIQLSGNSTNDLKFGYNLTYGTYTTIGHRQKGIIGLLGNEDYAHMGTTQQPQSYDLGGSLRAYAGFKEIVSLGINYFDGTRASMAYNDVATNELKFEKSKKHSYGIDFHVNLFNNNLKWNTEYWKGANKTTNLDENLKMETNGFYSELIFTHGIFTPFVRYEALNDICGGFMFPAPMAQALGLDNPFQEFTVGINSPHKNLQNRF